MAPPPVPTPTVPPATPAPLSPEAEAAARAEKDLSQRLGVAPSDITATSVVPHTWPDASLGLPRPGEVYAQVVTQGYIVTLDHGGQVYVYHVAGDNVRFDPASSAPLPS